MRARTLVGLALVLQACASRVGTVDAGTTSPPVDAVAPDIAAPDAVAPDVVTTDAIIPDAIDIDASVAVDVSVPDVRADVPVDTSAPPNCIDDVIALENTPVRELRLASGPYATWLVWVDDMPGGGRRAQRIAYTGAPQGEPFAFCDATRGGPSRLLQSWVSGTSLMGFLDDGGRVAFCSSTAARSEPSAGLQTGETIVATRPVSEGARFVRALTRRGRAYAFVDWFFSGSVARLDGIFDGVVGDIVDAAWQGDDALVLSHRDTSRAEGAEEIRLLRVESGSGIALRFTPLPSLPLRPAAGTVIATHWSDNHTIAVLPDGTVAVNHSVPTPGSRETTQELLRVEPSSTAVPVPEPLAGSGAWLAPITATIAVADPTDAVLVAWSSHGGGGFNSVLNASYVNTTDRTVPPPRVLRNGLPDESQVTGVALDIDRTRSRALIAWSSRARASAGSRERFDLSIACMRLP